MARRCEGDGTGARARQRRRCEEDDAGLGKSGPAGGLPMGCPGGKEREEKREGEGGRSWARPSFRFFSVFTIFFFQILREEEKR